MISTFPFACCCIRSARRRGEWPIKTLVTTPLLTSSLRGDPAWAIALPLVSSQIPDHLKFRFSTFGNILEKGASGNQHVAHFLNKWRAIGRLSMATSQMPNQLNLSEAAEESTMIWIRHKLLIAQIYHAQCANALGAGLVLPPKTLSAFSWRGLPNPSSVITLL